jgi:hypothetical protein
MVREPLVHFLILGALLFGLDAWLRPTTPAASEIVVGEARVRSLAQNFRRTWQRPPTREELDALVEDHIREEVLYREALALGLDRDDTIVRRRLRQKIEFMSDESSALERPSDADLTQYLAEHADAFRVEPSATFVQVFLDPGKRGKSLEGDVRRLREALSAGTVGPSQAGDRLLMLAPRYDNAPQTDIARLFGTEFAQSIVRLPAGEWSGPVASGYGVHLVRLESLTAGGTPQLADVRPLVKREWTNARRREAAQAFYDTLRAKYKVVVQMPEPARP